MDTDDGDRVPSPDRRDLSYDAFEPGDPIGRGGNADVSIAQLPDGLRIALKEPRFQGTLRTETVESFLAEAETWATIDEHPHVVGLIDWGGTPLPWIAMEYMDGGSLADRLADGPLGVDTTVRVGREVCAAVRYAHRHGLVHLDLKPANVLFRAAETGPPVAKVGDWGLARFLAEHSGSIEGLSPQYAAPEQFDRDRFGDPDDFTDIYQVGAVVYEALTGRPPFEGSGVAVMRAVLDDEPDPPTTVDPALPAAADEVLLRALATRKEDRYETVVDLRRALERFTDGGSGPTAADSHTEDAGDSRTGTGTGSGSGATPSADREGTAGEKETTGRIEGTVDFYDDERETGFVTSPDLDGDVFFYAADLDIPSVGEGDRLRFGVREAGDERELVDVERIEQGARPERQASGHDGTDGDPIAGVVDFFNDTGGYGFIESPDVDEAVFFHMEDIGGPDLTEGQEVTFRVEPAEKGPRAVDVEREDGDGAAGGSSLFDQVREGLGVGSGSDTAEGAGTEPADADTTGGAGADPADAGGSGTRGGGGADAADRVVGTVDFFNDTGGYGFIETDATDEDVFFHMEDVGGPDLQEGQEVSFEVDHREKGPVAMRLKRL